MDNREHTIPNFFRTMRLQTLLTLVLLAVVIPLVLALVYVINVQAGDLLGQQADEHLRLNNVKLESMLTAWLDQHQKTLVLMVSQMDIISMEPERQLPFLISLNKAYPKLFLTMTTDANGRNITRNDGGENQDYSDRAWYQGAIKGTGLSTQTLISRTSGRPALNMALAIRNDRGAIIGVGSIVSELDEISSEVQASPIGSTGYAYIIDPQNQVVAHPDPAYSSELRKMDEYPPVQAMRSGISGAYRFTDAEGVAWRAHIKTLDNQWGIISQQQESELLAPQRKFQAMAIFFSLGALLAMAILASLAVRQALRPVARLTEVATAIAAGDLTQTAPVEHEDEIGTLAQAFNLMTSQLREMISTLEQRIENRTRALQASYEVSQRLAAIQNLDDLLNRVAEDVSKAFGYYHVQVYLYDDAGENLVMMGGTGEAGQILLQRGHKLAHGRGLVGRAAQSGETIYVPNTDQDATWLPNPLLPETKSEAALPLVAAEQVLGVLDVQIDRTEALETSDIELLQSVANQVAVAVQNARRFGEAKIEAEMETYASSIAQKIQTAVSIESVLEIAVRELSERLGARQGDIEVTLKGMG